MVAAFLRRCLHGTIALALPPRCPGCGDPVALDHRFCSPCWQALRFIGPPWCASCNTPFAFDRGEGTRCLRCLAAPPRHAGIRAAVAYGAVARRLALQLKYGGRLGAAETMARAIAPMVPPEVDLLVPVPLHRWRLWRRGFNQSVVIAESLGRLRGVPIDRRTLVRRRATVPLRGLGPRQRALTVRGAFAVRHPAVVSGRAIGLVDDVHTSGATADACTRALLAAGAKSVTVLCWARVLPGGEGDAP